MSLPLRSSQTLAYFQFREGGGTTAKSDPLEAVSDPPVATLVGTTAWTNDGPARGITSVGMAGNSGSPQYLSCPSILFDGAKDWTIAIWVKPDTFLPHPTNDVRIWHRRGVGSPNNSIDLLYRAATDGGGYIWFRGQKNGVGVGAGGTGLKGGAGIGISAGNWHRIVVTSGFGYTAIYVDGVERAKSTTYEYPCWNGGGDYPFIVGAMLDGGGPSAFFQGRVAMFQVDGRMWTPEEVEADYKYNVPYPCEQNKWVRSPGPILMPNQAWHKTTAWELQEPTVIPPAFDGDIWRMWFTGGWTSATSQSIGYAESLDGERWTGYNASPVLGQGFGGEPAGTGRSVVIRHGGAYHIFYNTQLPGGALKYATSVDGKTWTGNKVIFAANAQAWMNGFGNCEVVRNKENTGWVMIFEAFGAGDSTWKLGLATSANIDGPYTMDADNPFTGIAPFTGGMVGGPTIQVIDGVYHMWAQTGKVGNLPTSVYRWTSANAKNWTRVSDVPILAPSVRSVDQVVDPCVVEYKGKSYVYFCENDNLTPRGYISMATYDGPLRGLVAGGIDGRVKPTLQATDPAVLAGIVNIQGRLPAALVGGRMDSRAADIAASAITASSVDAGAVTKIQTGLATQATAIATKAVTDKLDTTLEDDGANFRFKASALANVSGGLSPEQSAKLDAIDAKTGDIHTKAALLGTQGVTVVGPLTWTGALEVLRGYDYTQDSGFWPTWTSDQWPSLAGATISLVDADDDHTYIAGGVVVVAGGASQTVGINLPDSVTAILPKVTKKVRVKAVLANGDDVPLVGLDLTVAS